MVMGTPVVALCGKVWVPAGIPNAFPSARNARRSGKASLATTSNRRDLGPARLLDLNRPPSYASAMADPEPAHRTLVLVRHAKSSWDSDVDDHDRPLSGVDAMPWPSDRNWPDAASVQTWCCVPRPSGPGKRGSRRWRWAQAAEVRYQPEIYHAWVPELTSIIRELPDTASTVWSSAMHRAS